MKLDIDNLLQRFVSCKNEMNKVTHTINKNVSIKTTCQHKNITTTVEHYTCIDCGFILSDKIISTYINTLDSNGNDNGNSNSNNCGLLNSDLFISYNLSTKMSRPLNKVSTWTTSIDKIRYYEIEYLKILDDLNRKWGSYFPKINIYIDTLELYNKIRTIQPDSQKKIYKGSIKDGMISVCLFHVFKYHSIYICIKELCNIMNINHTIFSKCQKNIDDLIYKYTKVNIHSNLDSNTEINSNGNNNILFKLNKILKNNSNDIEKEEHFFVNRCCNELNLIHKFKKLVFLILKKYKSTNCYSINNSLHKNYSLNTLVGGIIYLIVLDLNIEMVSVDQISNKCFVNKTTVKNFCNFLLKIKQDLYYNIYNELL
jgi:transcription initiation factor TFIIIB Brf1 subunit/transcription initiation factor TFIIB